MQICESLISHGNRVFIKASQSNDYSGNDSKHYLLMMVDDVLVVSCIFIRDTTIDQIYCTAISNSL